MKAYEYKVISKPIPTVMRVADMEKQAQEIEGLLNSLGKDGWKLTEWQNSLLIFVREKNS